MISPLSCIGCMWIGLLVLHIHAPRLDAAQEKSSRCRSYVFDLVIYPLESDESVLATYRPLANTQIFARQDLATGSIRLISPDAVEIQTPQSWSRPFGQGTFVVQENFFSKDSALSIPLIPSPDSSPFYPANISNG